MAIGCVTVSIGSVRPGAMRSSATTTLRVDDQVNEVLASLVGTTLELDLDLEQQFAHLLRVELPQLWRGHRVELASASLLLAWRHDTLLIWTRDNCARG
jgi:hypothetical protein